jgi:hypothetical protein
LRPSCWTNATSGLFAIRFATPSAIVAPNPERTRLKTTTSLASGYRAANARTSLTARAPAGVGLSTTM